MVQDKEEMVNMLITYLTTAGNKLQNFISLHLILIVVFQAANMQSYEILLFLNGGYQVTKGVDIASVALTFNSFLQLIMELIMLILLQVPLLA